MVPLTTRQGLAATEIVSLVGGRDVLIWGAGDLAMDTLVSLTKAGAPPKAFLHTQPAASGGTGELHGLPIWMVADALASPASAFVVIATTSFRRRAEEECLRAGLRKNVDFISYLSVSRPQAIVEIVSDSRHGCRWESRTHRPASAFMETGTFARVLGKLAVDLPLLSHLELAWWGEPLLHPELPGIIDLAQRVVPCTVATGLAVDAPIDPVVQAQPSRLDIQACGFGDSYEDAIPGASWQLFLTQFAALRASIEKHKPHTRFQVKLYRSRFDAADIEQRWRDLLRGSGIGLSLQVPYVMPYDHVLSRCETGDFPEDVRHAVDALPWNMADALVKCRTERHRPCLSQRIFPVVNTDLSVSLCHLYDGPSIANDYLSVAWADLLAARHRSPFCLRCQQCGLHRLDIDILARDCPDRAPAYPAPTGESK